MERSCSFCKKKFASFPGDKNRYCSEECHQAYLKRQRDNHIWKSERADKCLLCGGELTKGRKSFCSKQCARRYNHIKSGAISHPDILVKICPVCGAEFKTWKSRQHTCSVECANYRHKHRTDRTERIKAVIVDDDIDLIKLYKRDHGQCQLCGLMTNFEDYQMKGAYKICGNMYPSIDHIKPISKGGLHSWDNIQLAHRRCNSSKGNR